MNVRDEDLEVVEVPLASLKAYDGNAKKHDNANIEAIESSIKEFGFRNPILAWHNEDGVAEIVAGHGRALAAQKLGIENVPCIFVDDLSDAQRRMLTLADNQTTLMTGWDKGALSIELDSLLGTFDITSFGFDEPTEDDFVEPELPFAVALDTSRDYIVLQFKTAEDWTWAAQVLGVQACDLLGTGKSQRRGHGRVIDGVKALEGAMDGH